MHTVSYTPRDSHKNEHTLQIDLHGMTLMRGMTLCISSHDYLYTVSNGNVIPLKHGKALHKNVIDWFCN